MDEQQMLPPHKGNQYQKSAMAWLYNKIDNAFQELITIKTKTTILKITMLSISVKGISSTVSFEPCTSSIIPRYDFPCCLQTQPKPWLNALDWTRESKKFTSSGHRITCNCKQLNFSAYDFEEIHKNSYQKSTVALQTPPPKNKQARPCSQTQSVISYKS